MGAPGNRCTQINMHALKAAAKPLPTSGKSAASPRLQSTVETIETNGRPQKSARSAEQGVLDAKQETGKAKSGLDKSLMTISRLRTIWASPWERYEKIYDRELAGSLAVAVRREPPIKLVHVRKLPKKGAEKALHMFRGLQHCNIVVAQEALMTDDGLYIVLEPMSISLEEVVGSPAYPDGRQLAAILGQVSSARY